MCTCRVFSVEKNESGKRAFIVTTYHEFWRQYQEMIPASRHYYEIIRPRPCHMYFGEFAGIPSRSSCQAASHTYHV